MPNLRTTAWTLCEQAARCRRLADAVRDAEMENRLRRLAGELEQQAAALEAAERCAH